MSGKEGNEKREEKRSDRATRGRGGEREREGEEVMLLPCYFMMLCYFMLAFALCYDMF